MPRNAAVYAVCYTASGRQLAFRVGQPTDWNTAQNRWQRLDDRRIAGRLQFIPWARKRYIVRWLEVRTVDADGRGLGSERHGRAFPVPYRALRLA